MKSLLAALAFLFASPAAFAVVYKCQLPDGQIEYRSVPCVNAREVPAHEANVPVSRSTPPLAAADNLRRECEARQMRMHFSDMPVRATFQVVADFAGHRLVLDPAISGRAAYHYDCVEWDTVLQDLAQRHGLVAKVEEGVIRVVPRAAGETRATRDPAPRK